MGQPQNPSEGQPDQTPDWKKKQQEQQDEEGAEQDEGRKIEPGEAKIHRRNSPSNRPGGSPKGVCARASGGRLSLAV